MQFAMNQKNVYHLDLKASNVLIDSKYNIRIIDWGLSSIIENKKQIPLAVGYRPLHFNMPYSVILMNTEAITYIENVIYGNYSKEDLTIDLASDLIERYFRNFLSKN